MELLLVGKKEIYIIVIVDDYEIKFSWKNQMNTIRQEWKGYTAKVVRINTEIVKKIYLNKFKWMIKREVECLKRLEKYPNFPICLGYSSNFIYIEYRGERVRGKIPKKYNSQVDDILQALKECNIIHRDAQVKNLLIMEIGRHTSELQSHSFISYAVFCLKKKK